LPLFFFASASRPPSAAGVGKHKDFLIPHRPSQPPSKASSRVSSAKYRSLLASSSSSSLGSSKTTLPLSQSSISKLQSEQPHESEHDSILTNFHSSMTSLPPLEPISSELASSLAKSISKPNMNSQEITEPSSSSEFLSTLLNDNFDPDPIITGLSKLFSEIEDRPSSGSFGEFSQLQQFKTHIENTIDVIKAASARCSRLQKMLEQSEEEYAHIFLGLETFVDY
jgi:hypothetical protein